MCAIYILKAVKYKCYDGGACRCEVSKKNWHIGLVKWKGVKSSDLNKECERNFDNYMKIYLETYKKVYLSINTDLTFVHFRIGGNVS